MKEIETVLQVSKKQIKTFSGFLFKGMETFLGLSLKQIIKAILRFSLKQVKTILEILLQQTKTILGFSLTQII